MKKLRSATTTNHLNKEHHVAGKMDEIKGRAKKAVGEITDDKGLQREGKADQAAGKVKSKVDKASDWVEDKVDTVNKKTK
jgi:uncharacterized protein YjbJ (UPF0337 family)